MKFLELKKSLSSPYSVYSITGDDEFLISQAVKIIKEGLVTCFEEFNYAKVDSDATKVADYSNIINTMPFGDSYRVVVFYKPLAEQVKAINKLINNDLGKVVIVCVQPSAKLNNEQVVDCSHLDKVDLVRWINNYLAKSNTRIEKTALDYIVDMSGGDMAYLNTELPKLIAYVGEQAISYQDVDKTFTKNKNYFVYHLSNAIDSRNKKMQFDVLNTLTLPQNVGEIFTFLGAYFRRMFYCAISKSSDNEIASLLKVKPYSITKAKQYVVKNKPQYYIALFNKYVELDYSIKSGKISPQNAMYELLLGVNPQ